MPTPDTGPFAEFVQRLIGYAPTLTAGLLVLLLGVVVGWLAKKAVVRVLIWLRLDRLGGNASWRAALGKGDVRAAFYDLAGNAVFLLLVLVFLDNSLEIWGLVVLSRMIEGLIVYLPNLALVALIFGGGVFLANTLAGAIENTLEEEGAPRPRLVAKGFKAAALGMVGALALWQLNFAREIVLAAFLIGFGALGIAFAIAVGLGSAKAIQKGWDALFDKNRRK
ncbi:MAG: hypothetical protein LJF15_02165 [Acidobacteria bacterium]|jgi:hypothetical protein|nr:hypothetical protein [Acidobacteriota bacterium]